MNRRTFLASVGAAGVSLASGIRLLGSDAGPRPSLGMIGCGWYGGVDLRRFARTAGVDIVSLCDVNTAALGRTLKAVSAYQSSVPATFSDYREMLASRPHDIVIVATPDHWHALAGIAAMKAGADVYLEKPVSHDVMEGEALVAAARKYGRVVQVNTQRRSSPHFAGARDKYLRTGRLGTIGLVETYCYVHMRLSEVVPDSAPPAGFNYDLWTGPAPLTPFKSPKESIGWRAFMDYSNGIIGDMGVHMFDAARWMLGLGWPSLIQSTGGILGDRASSADIPDTMRSVFRYSDLDVSWEHRTWGVSPIPLGHWTDQWGLRFLGTKGALNLTLLGYVFTPADGGPREGYNMLSKTGDLENIDLASDLDIYKESENRHCLDFMGARKTRTPPVADIEEGHISTACCELANISLKLGRPVAYDPSSRTVTGDPEATRLLARPYRLPWSRPDPASV
jgi:predicted dehydrogenase